MRSLKNAKVTSGLEERQIKVSSQRPIASPFRRLACFRCPPVPISDSPSDPGAMFFLFFLHLLLASGVPSAGTSDLRKGDPTGEQQTREFSALTLNESCREQILQRARTVMCQLLRLDHPPRLTASMTHQVREQWAKEGRKSPEPSIGGQHLNITSNQTLVSQRGGCLQISQRVTLDDLGWQNWVLSPTSFTFTECLGCHCHRIKEETQLPLWSLACGLQEPSHQDQADAQQRRCCRPRKSPLPFLFLKEDGSLNLQTVRLAHDCHCRP
ncbi:growth/differentiation factor 15-like [Pantherophis guttatus]|uniref:Growth/differentiation factor 15-like n=1 Tax=Pantherophis guttatus TaxID=94885 RepID=A0A6P9CMF9_PANGU|nr:growth/differentiation factor 15-like [Pantherophis guttatus]